MHNANEASADSPVVRHKCLCFRMFWAINAHSSRRGITVKNYTHTLQQAKKKTKNKRNQQAAAAIIPTWLMLALLANATVMVLHNPTLLSYTLSPTKMLFLRVP